MRLIALTVFMLIFNNHRTSSRPSSLNSRRWLQDCNFLILDILEFGCDLDTMPPNSPCLPDVALSLARNYFLSISHTWQISLPYISLSNFAKSDHLLEDMFLTKIQRKAFTKDSLCSCKSVVNVC